MFSQYEAEDPWVQVFVADLDEFISSFRNTLSSANYESLISLVAGELTYQMERAVLKIAFNRVRLLYPSPPPRCIHYTSSLVGRCMVMGSRC